MPILKGMSSLTDICPGCNERDKAIAQLQCQVQQQSDRIHELERRLGQNSRNSSQPPSSDSPSVPRFAKKSPSGRKPGGQPGHEDHQRDLVPLEQVDAVVPVKPTRCHGCGAELDGEDPSPYRHQVTEIPKVLPRVIEYQLHTLNCSYCGETTKAALPDGVPDGAFGPRLQAIVAVCAGVYHLSKRTVKGLLENLLGTSICLGSVTTCEQATSEALEAVVNEARAHVEKQAVAYVDETGWREGNKRAWLWTAVTASVTVFMVHARRGAIAARALLGSFAGFLVSDRWNAYNIWSVDRRQLCWAHLIRTFTAFSEAAGEAGRIGRALLEEVEQMFVWWYRTRDGTLARPIFRAYMEPLRQRVEGLLGEGRACGHRKIAETCRRILKLAPALWTFVRVEGVEPTNNAAERAIRPGVLWRKGSFGTHSAEGSRFAERMMTVAATLKQQGRNVVDYVTQVCESALHGKLAPSLLPCTTIPMPTLTAA